MMGQMMIMTMGRSSRTTTFYPQKHSPSPPHHQEARVSDVPYANATSGASARDETTKLLRRMGCDSVGFMDDFAKHEVLLAFTHRGRPVQLRASAKGWAAMYLRAEPWTSRRRDNKATYEAKALNQGLIAVNSIIRDWVKGQVVAVECGVMSFEAMFMAHMIASDGRTMLDHATSNGLLQIEGRG
jgi:hypothetical protein